MLISDLFSLALWFVHAIHRRLARKGSSFRPATNFYAYINQQWIDDALVPPHLAEWNTWTAMQERTDEQCCKLLDELAPPSSAKAVAPEEQLAAVWKIANDEAALEIAGLAPLAPVLQACDDLSDRTAALASLHRFGVHAFFEPATAIDPADSRWTRLRLRPSGLGLPELAYYLEPEHSKLRDAYRAHVARVLTLLGDSEAEARHGAAAALGLEVALAVARRRPEAFVNPAVALGLECGRLCCRCAPTGASARQRPYAQRAGLPLGSAARRLRPAQLAARCAGGVEWPCG